MNRAVATLVLTLVLVLSGCLGAMGPNLDEQGVETPEETRFLEDAVFNTSDKWSHTVVNGTYGIAEPKEVFVPSLEPFGDEISIGIVLPEGLEDGETVPVVADIGPYYGELEGPVTDPDDARLDNFLIENLVPHGYAVAMVSVPGTGNSGGCEDYFGPREQAAVDAAVEYLGEADWSNGNVGLIGKSYDGSTPWEAASTPESNDHLKTIVPMAGIPSFHELHFMNGTAESRASFLNTAYWSFGLTRGGAFGPLAYEGTDWVEEPDARMLERACPAVAEHVVNGATGTATGGQDPTGYWAERSFKPEVLEHYVGSVFIVHGLQDWNVHPDVVTDIWGELDVKKKLWFGQWSHIYPDRPQEVKDCDLCPYPDGVRWDFAEVLLRWFDSELKGMDVDTGPTVWSMDNRGGWHASDYWPPQDRESHSLYLGDGVLRGSETDHGAATLLTPPEAEDLDLTVEAAPGVAASTKLEWTSQAFADRTRITGEPRFHFTVTPTSSDGNLRADLYDVSPDDERKWVGHAYMNIRYAAGGDTPQEVTPGEDLPVRMQLFPLDIVVPAGHHLELTLVQDSPVPTATGPMMVHWGEGYGSALTFEETTTMETPLPWETGANASGNATATSG